MGRKLHLLATAGVLAMLAACTNAPPASAPPAAPEPPKMGNLDNLRSGAAPAASPDEVKISIQDPRSEKQTISEIRAAAITEAAQSYGTQMGYARRGWEIEQLLQSRSMQFSQVFDFSRVVSEAPVKAGYIVPPVVSRSVDAFVSIDGGKEASVAEEYLTIVSPGKIRPVVPTWRDYLIFTARVPDELARSLHPRDGAEKQLFDRWFREGWAAGVETADSEISSRIDRLTRDYEGMLQYRRLVSQGMMDRMVLEDGDFGVTGGGNEMRIGSRTVRIVSDAEFETNPNRWSTRAVTARDALIVGTGQIPPLSLADALRKSGQ